MELPQDLLIIIFLQLPVKSLLRCKCVCKDWRSVIQRPHFVERQCLLSDTKNNKLLCFREDSLTDAHVIFVYDRQTFENLEDLEWPPFVAEHGVEPADEYSYFSRQIDIFGPVNGVYCIFRSLSDECKGTLTLWNPTTKEYYHIPPQVAFPIPYTPADDHYDPCYFSHQKDRVTSLNIGFGFDHTIDQYKVVVIFQTEDLVTISDKYWHLWVCNYAYDSWRWRRIIKLDTNSNSYPPFEGLDPPFPQLVVQPAGCNSFLNGVFHWKCSKFYNRRPGYHILTCDMTSYNLQLLDGPPLHEHRLTLDWSVLMLKDNVAVISSYDASHLSSANAANEVWMMMEYGVKSSWAILFTFQGGNDWVPMSIPYDDCIFVCDDGCQLISLSFDEDQQVKEHGLYVWHGFQGWSLGILKYMETLVTPIPQVSVINSINLCFKVLI